MAVAAGTEVAPTGVVFDDPTSAAAVAVADVAATFIATAVAVEEAEDLAEAAGEATDPAAAEAAPSITPILALLHEELPAQLWYTDSAADPPHICVEFPPQGKRHPPTTPAMGALAVAIEFPQ